MTSTTAAGSALAISTGTPATLDRVGYAALNYDEIGYVDKIGTIGRTFGKAEFQALRRAKDKLKGATDYGALAPSMAYDETDPGQITLRAAADDKTTRLYPMRLTLPSGEIRYFRVRVFGAPEGVEGADAIMMTTATIEICTPNVLVPASGAPLPVFVVQPSISPSSGVVGATFTATDGTASNATGYTRRWLLNGSAIGTGSTVTPNATGTLTLEVTATGPGGTSAPATSSGVTVSAAATPAPVFSTQPSISPSSGAVGTTFTANDGAASNTTGYTRRWLLGTTAIGTGTTVTPNASGSLTLEVTATGPGGTKQATSSAVTVAAAPTPTPSPIAFTSFGALGDSITNRETATSGNAWIDLVATAMNAGTPLNQGISGTVLQNSPDASGSPRANNGRDRYLAALLGANKRDGVFVAYGFNDARYVGAPTTFNVAAYKAQLQGVTSGLIVGGYTIGKIGIVSPYWISDTGLTSGSSGFTGQSRSGFEAFVSAAREVAQEYGVWFADTYAAMRDNGGTSLINTADNIHPIDAGHLVIKNAVMASTRLNTAAMPAIAAAAGATGELGFTLTAPASGAVTNYTVQYTVGSSYIFTGSQTVTSLTGGKFTGLIDGPYTARVRANFADGTSSPWAFSSTITLTSSGVFAADSFLGDANQALASHAPNVGGSWLAQTGLNASIRLDGTGGAYFVSTAAGMAVQGSPPGSDYSVEADFVFKSLISNDTPGIALRMDPVANSMYFTRYSQTNGVFQLYRVNGGSTTVIGTSAAIPFTSGTKRVKLTALGSAISVSVDGSQIISVTNSDVAGPGYAGLRAGVSATADTGLHIGNLKAFA